MCTKCHCNPSKQLSRYFNSCAIINTPNIIPRTVCPLCYNTKASHCENWMGQILTILLLIQILDKRLLPPLGNTWGPSSQRNGFNSSAQISDLNTIRMNWNTAYWQHKNWPWFWIEMLSVLWIIFRCTYCIWSWLNQWTYWLKYMEMLSSDIAMKWAELR